MKRVLALQACPRGIHAAVYQRKGGRMHLQASAQERGSPFDVALDGVLDTLRADTTVPRDTICLSHKAVALCLELPRATLESARWQQLLRWESEPFLPRMGSPAVDGEDWLQQSPQLDAGQELCFGWTPASPGEGTAARLVSTIARCDLSRWQTSLRNRGLRLRAIYPHLAGAAAANGSHDGTIVELHGEELALTTLKAGHITGFELSHLDEAGRLASELSHRGVHEATLYGEGIQRLEAQWQDRLQTHPAPELGVPASLLGAARHALSDGTTPLAPISTRKPRPKLSRPMLLAGLLVVGLLLGFLTLRVQLKNQQQRSRQAWAAAAADAQRSEEAQARHAEQTRRAAELEAQSTRLQAALATNQARADVLQHWFRRRPAFLCILFACLSQDLPPELSLTGIDYGLAGIELRGSTLSEQAVYRLCLALERSLASEGLRVQPPELSADTRPLRFRLQLLPEEER